MAKHGWTVYFVASRTGTGVVESRTGLSAAAADTLLASHRAAGWWTTIRPDGRGPVAEGPECWYKDVAGWVRLCPHTLDAAWAVRDRLMDVGAPTVRVRERGEDVGDDVAAYPTPRGWDSV